MYAHCLAQEHWETKTNPVCVSERLCRSLSDLRHLQPFKKRDWQDKQRWKNLQREATKPGRESWSGVVERERCNKSTEEPPPSLRPLSGYSVRDWEEGRVSVCLLLQNRETLRESRRKRKILMSDTRCRTSIFPPCWLLRCLLGNILFLLYPEGAGIFLWLAKMTVTFCGGDVGGKCEISSFVLHQLSKDAAL